MKKILIALMSVMITVSLLGIGTYAYFSDTETSTGNTFTAGTLDIKLWGSNWQDSVTGTWTASNMKPGDTVTGILYMRNAGSLPILALLCDLDVTGEIDGAGGGARLDDYLYVKSWWAGYGHDRSNINWATGPHTPDELIRSYAGHLEGICTNSSDDILPLLGITQVDTSGGNDVFALEYTFEFKETVANQNNAQGDSLTIRYTITGLSDTCANTGY